MAREKVNRFRFHTPGRKPPKILFFYRISAQASTSQGSKEMIPWPTTRPQTSSGEPFLLSKGGDPESRKLAYRPGIICNYRQIAMLCRQR
ncbi:hypothetical protein ACOHYD_05605 [Desulfobacterota bacterium M19]